MSCLYDAVVMNVNDFLNDVENGVTAKGCQEASDVIKERKKIKKKILQWVARKFSQTLNRNNKKKINKSNCNIKTDKWLYETEKKKGETLATWIPPGVRQHGFQDKRYKKKKKSIQQQQNSKIVPRGRKTRLLSLLYICTYICMCKSCH